MKRFASPITEKIQRLNPRQFLIAVVCIAALLYLYLSTLARSPKGSMNVMQAVYVLLMIIIFARQHTDARITDSKSENIPKALPGLLPALAVGICVWALSVPFPFISDDYAHVFHARQPLLDSLWDSLVHGQSGAFLRPVSFATIYLDYRLWHQWAPGYHISNLLIHLAGVAGIYFFCKGMRFRHITATTAALLFAAWPVHAETVPWMGARFDLLGTCLTIWMAVCYLKYRETGRPALYVWTMVFLFLAVFSKESAYMAPFLLLALEGFILPERRWKPVFGIFCATAVLFIYRWMVLGGIGGYLSPSGEPATLEIHAKILEGLFLRVPAQTLLGFNWSPPRLHSIGIIASFIAAILLVSALTARRGSINIRRTLFCLAWIVVSALPAHPLIFIGADLTNSRILYLGSVGAVILVALLLSGIEAPGIRRLSGGLLVLLLSAALLCNLAALKWTSRLSDRFLSEIVHLEPSPPPHAVYIFHNMPFTVRGVFFFRAGLQEAVNLAYGREDLRVMRAEDLSPNMVSGTDSVFHWDWEESGNLRIQK